jgi:hypothetical protein
MADAFIGAFMGAAWSIEIAGMRQARPAQEFPARGAAAPLPGAALRDKSHRPPEALQTQLPHERQRI